MILVDYIKLDSSNREQNVEDNIERGSNFYNNTVARTEQTEKNMSNRASGFLWACSSF